MADGQVDRLLQTQLSDPIVAGVEPPARIL